MEIDCSHYVILVCDPGHAFYTALWEELGLKFVRNTFLGSDSELACPWFGFLPDSHHSIFQVLQQLFLKLTALPADSCFFPQWWAFSKALSTILSNCPAHPMLSLGTSCGGDRHNAKIGTRPLISHPQIYSLPHFEKFMLLLPFLPIKVPPPFKTHFLPIPRFRDPTGQHM